MSAPPEAVDGKHPEFGHLLLVYFGEDGRMKLREKPSRCSAPDEHARELVVKAVFVEECDQPDAAPGSSAWMVHAGAPDAQTAHKTALTVGKALGAQLNPVLREMGVETR